MTRGQKIDYLLWTLENDIGKLWQVKIFGWHFTFHKAYYKNGYWHKNK